MLRDAKLEDLPAIVEIYTASIPARMATADLEPVTVLERRPWFDRHGGNRPLWVLEEDGDIAGWLSFEEFYGRPAYHLTAEVSVYVDPDHQGRGIGRRLLGAGVQRAPELGLANLIGFIFGHNEASLALFAAFGFERWGELPQVAELDGILRDVVVVGKTLQA
jgi:phosphinothricin acetyltransferase